MTVFNFFQSHFNNLPLAAVYIRSNNGCSQIVLYHDSHRVNDRDFFKKLSKQFGVGKNTFTNQLDNLHPDGVLGKTLYTEKIGNQVTHYVVIKNLNYYI